MPFWHGFMGWAWKEKEKDISDFDREKEEGTWPF